MNTEKTPAQIAFFHALQGTHTVEPLDLRAAALAVAGSGSISVRIIDTVSVRPTEEVNGERGVADYTVRTRSVELSVVSVSYDFENFVHKVVGREYESDENFWFEREFVFTVGSDTAPAAYTVRELNHGSN